MVNIGCAFKIYRPVGTFYLSVCGERCLHLHRDWWSHARNPGTAQHECAFTLGYHSTIKGFHPSAHKHSCRHVRETIALDSALEDGGWIICQSCSGITVRFFQCRGHSQTVPRSAECRGCCTQRRVEIWRAVRNSSPASTDKDHTFQHWDTDLKSALTSKARYRCPPRDLTPDQFVDLSRECFRSRQADSRSEIASINCSICF